LGGKGQTTWEVASVRAHVQYLRRVLEQERAAKLQRGASLASRVGDEGEGSAPSVAVFYKQGAAFRRADDLAESRGGGRAASPVRLWAEEYAGRSDGSRRYLVATVTAFWDHYRRLPKERRLHYELIREGDPCHVYLDLEYGREGAEGDARDGPGMVETAVGYVRLAFEARFPDVPWAGGARVVLDSSTASKFSRHVVIQWGGVAFADNAHVGALVDEALALARADREAGRPGPGPLEPGCLFWDTTGCFVDTSVYSRNRCFRLFLSSKAGKGVPLTRVPCPGERGHEMGEQEVFEASLACHVSADARLLKCGAGRPVAGARGRVVMSSSASTPSRRAAATAPPEGLSGVEAFVRRIADTRACKPPGTTGVRAWTLFPDIAAVTFYLTGTRFCHRVDREHRSNGVYYTVDLASGAADQRCFDPDCRGYLHYIPVPLDVLSEADRDEYAAYARHWAAALPKDDAERAAHGAPVTPPGTPVKRPQGDANNTDNTDNTDDTDDQDTDDQGGTDDREDAAWMEAALQAERIALEARARASSSSPPEQRQLVGSATTPE